MKFSTEKDVEEDHGDLSRTWSYYTKKNDHFRRSAISKNSPDLPENKRKSTDAPSLEYNNSTDI